MNKICKTESLGKPRLQPLDMVDKQDAPPVKITMPENPINTPSRKSPIIDTECFHCREKFQVNASQLTFSNEKQKRIFICNDCILNQM